MNELTKIVNMDELSEQNAQVLWKAISVGLSEKFKTVTIIKTEISNSYSVQKCWTELDIKV